MQCSQCGLEFEGENCPKCGNLAIRSKKKPFYKKWWFILIVIIMLLCGIGKFLGRDSSREESEKFNWSSFSMHEKLPEPKSKEGKDFYDYSDSLDITVCNTTKSDYKEYIEKCESEFGYTIDKQKTSDSFYAKSFEGYEVTIDYNEDDEEMDINLTVVENKTVDNSKTSDTNAETLTEKESNTQSTVSTNKQEETESEEQDSVNGISNEFKNAMDSYESFINEYVDFMGKYKNNPSDLTLIADYSKYIKKYSDMCDKFEKWKNEDLNSAEMAYYIDVQGRVSKKLMEVAN